MGRNVLQNFFHVCMGKDEDAAGLGTTAAAVKLKQARQQLAQFIKDTSAYPFDSSARTAHDRFWTE
jgi:hypothetical protein